jgi:hypothetical protein
MLHGDMKPIFSVIWIRLKIKGYAATFLQENGVKSITF